MAAVLLEAGSDPDAETLTEMSTLGMLMGSHQADLSGLVEPLMQVLAEWQEPDAELAARLIAHGAEIDLRFAAGLGDLARMQSYSLPDGSLDPGAGRFFRPASGDSVRTAAHLSDQQILDEALSYGVNPLLGHVQWDESPRTWAGYGDAHEIMDVLAEYEERWQAKDEG